VGVGGGLASRWGVTGVSRGYNRRVFASVEAVQERHLDATGGGSSGGHFRGEGAPSWLVLATTAMLEGTQRQEFRI
jgi:hypothetical protein